MEFDNEMKFDNDFFSDTPENIQSREKYIKEQKEFIRRYLLQNDKIMLNGNPVKDMTIQYFIQVLLTLKNNYSKKFQDFNTNIDEIQPSIQIRSVFSVNVDHLKLVKIIDSEMQKLSDSQNKSETIFVGGTMVEPYIYIILC